MKAALIYDPKNPEIHRCESCGPLLESVYAKDGTYWCERCFDAEGWNLPLLLDEEVDD